MSAKRNPFNENVNRLMEKIFAGKEAPRAPRKMDREEAVAQPGAGILHDTKPGKKIAGEYGQGIIMQNSGQGRERSAGQPEENRKGGGKTAPKDSLEFSLQDIRRATKKIRETTKQMQQMTLQMWANATKKRGEMENIYGEERIPPRRTGETDQKGTQEPKVRRDAERGTAGDSVWRLDAENAEKKTGNFSRRPFAPQYRMEDAPDESVPERIRECRQMAHSPQGCRMTKEELFFRQAKLMEDYEDDCLYPGDFSWYFPTYQAMNTAQLRGYFTWRAQVRRGSITRAPLSFAFVYVYELLHQVGAKTPEEGFSLLKAFWENYREYDVQMDRYMQDWLCDYVVYYNLDRELLLNSQDAAFDNAMLVFLHPQEHGDPEYFAAVCALSKYNMEGSKFYKQYGEDVCKVTCGVLRALTVYYEKHGKKTLPEKYFGTLTSCAYQMFVSSVFYDYKKYAEYEYEMNPLHRYRCVNGHWSCEKYFGGRAKSKELGLILYAIDARMRERYEYKALLKQENITKLVMNLIEKEIDRLLEEKKKNAAPVIEIDLTKLSGIRRAAELTRERLIVEGSEEDAETDFWDAGHSGEEETVRGAEAGQLEFVWEDGSGAKENSQRSETLFKPQQNMGPSTENASKPRDDALLNEAERMLLRCLLEGASYQEFLRGRRLMLSVVVDAINEKLFDLFGDTVIVFDGDAPQVLEDYAEEAAALLSGV